jgi:hypothetical protein
MALELKLAYPSVDSDGAFVIAQDDTTYGNGELERNEVALYLYGWKKFNDKEDIALTLDNGDPNLTTQWQVQTTLDGWYSFMLFAVQVWTPSTNVVANDLLFYNNSLWRALQDSLNVTPGTDVLYYVEYTGDLTEETTLPSTVQVGTNNYLHTIYSEIINNKIVVNKAKNNCGNCAIEDLADLYMQADVTINALFIAYGQERWADGEMMARRMQEIDKDWESTR